MSAGPPGARANPAPRNAQAVGAGTNRKPRTGAYRGGRPITEVHRLDTGQIKFTCARCGKRMTVAPKFAGRTTTCLLCGVPLSVPAQTEALPARPRPSRRLARATAPPPPEQPEPAPGLLESGELITDLGAHQIEVIDSASAHPESMPAAADAAGTAAGETLAGEIEFNEAPVHAGDFASEEEHYTNLHTNLHPVFDDDRRSEGGDGKDAAGRSGATAAGASGDSLVSDVDLKSFNFQRPGLFQLAPGGVEASATAAGGSALASGESSAPDAPGARAPAVDATEPEPNTSTDTDDAEPRARPARVQVKPRGSSPPEFTEFPAAFMDYSIVAEIGRGGMGTVWRAERKGHEAAIKILDPELARNEKYWSRFKHECEMLQLLDHPNIVQLVEYGEVTGRPYLVMEYVDGLDCRRHVSKYGPLPWPQATWVVREVCRALRAAYEQGLMHRDVKPDNFLLAGKRETNEEAWHPIVKLADFGLIKSITETRIEHRALALDADRWFEIVDRFQQNLGEMTRQRQGGASREISFRERVETIVGDLRQEVARAQQQAVSARAADALRRLKELRAAARALGLPASGECLGTPKFMAPEMWLEVPDDHRADIFALGVSWYYLVSGRYPFDGSDAHETMLSILHQDPIALPDIMRRVPKAPWQVIQKMLNKLPDQRYPTYETLEADLNRILEGEEPVIDVLGESLAALDDETAIGDDVQFLFDLLQSFMHQVAIRDDEPDDEIVVHDRPPEFHTQEVPLDSTGIVRIGPGASRASQKRKPVGVDAAGSAPGSENPPPAADCESAPLATADGRDSASDATRDPANAAPSDAASDATRDPANAAPSDAASDEASDEVISAGAVLTVRAPRPPRPASPAPAATPAPIADEPAVPSNTRAPAGVRAHDNEIAGALQVDSSGAPARAPAATPELEPAANEPAANDGSASDKVDPRVTALFINLDQPPPESTRPRPQSGISGPRRVSTTSSTETRPIAPANAVRPLTARKPKVRLPEPRKPSGILEAQRQTEAQGQTPARPEAEAEVEPFDTSLGYTLELDLQGGPGTGAPAKNAPPGSTPDAPPDVEPPN